MLLVFLHSRSIDATWINDQHDDEIKIIQKYWVIFWRINKLFNHIESGAILHVQELPHRLNWIFHSTVAVRVGDCINVQSLGRLANGSHFPTMTLQRLSMLTVEMHHFWDLSNWNWRSVAKVQQFRLGERQRANRKFLITLYFRLS